MQVKSVMYDAVAMCLYITVFGREALAKPLGGREVIMTRTNQPLDPIRLVSMVDLFCTPFVDLIQRMRLEYRNQQAIFDLPARKWWLPAPDNSGPDLSVRFHDRVAGNASGPASGPQSQMAQNLVLSWLAGGRIIELKTTPRNSAAEICRPRTHP